MTATIQSIRNKVQPSKRVIIILVLVALASGGLYATQTTYELYNEIHLEMDLYDVGGYDGTAGDRLLLSVGDRVYTQLKVVVIGTHCNGLDRVNAYLYDEEKTSILQSSQMADMGYDRFELTFDVDGYAFGYYMVVVKGIPSSHAVSVSNPDYDDWVDWMAWWNALSETDQLSWYEIWTETGGGIPRQPAQYLTEMKSDVFINQPDDTLVFVENPWDEIQFSLGAFVDGASLASGGTTAATVTFELIVTEGQVLGATLVIRDSENTRVIDTNDIASLQFNVNEGQADGQYTAKVYVVGARGWTGGQASITINIDNPDPLSGIARVYTVSESGWQEVTDGGILKGDILIEVEVLSGTPDSCVAILTGPAGAVSHAMEFDGTYWSVILNTRSLVNGLYSLSVEMTRSEDGAKCYLSVFDFDITGGLSSTLLILVLIGVAIAAVLVIVGRMSRNRQKLGEMAKRLKL
jgi:hypothetical protein